jgi:hypothetical protein
MAVKKPAPKAAAKKPAPKPTPKPAKKAPVPQSPKPAVKEGTTNPKKQPLKITPAGIAAFCWLNKKDDKFDKENPKHKITLKFPKEGADNQDEIDEFLDLCREIHDGAQKAASGGSANKLKAIQRQADSPVKDGDEKDAEDMHGYWLLEFNSKFKPQIVDAKKKALPADVWVAAGDLVKVACKLNAYGEDGEKGKAGLSRKLYGVQLIAKNNMGGNSANAFDEEEGFSGDTWAGTADEEVAEEEDEKPTKGSKKKGGGGDF